MKTESAEETLSHLAVKETSGRLNFTMQKARSFFLEFHF
jgi:hypothetical protein